MVSVVPGTLGNSTSPLAQSSAKLPFDATSASEELQHMLGVLEKHIVVAPEHIMREATEALELASLLEDHPAELKCLLCRASGYRTVGQYAEGLDDLLLALELARTYFSTEFVVGVMGHIEFHCAYSGDFHSVEYLFHEIEKRLHSSYHPGIKLLFLLSLGLSRITRHEADRAIEPLSQALDLATTIHEERTMYWCIHFLGKAAAMRGDYEGARSRFERARLFFLEHFRVHDLAEVDLDLGRLLMRTEKYPSAEVWLQRSLEMAERHELVKLRIDTSIALASLARARSDADRAMEHLAVARSLAGDSVWFAVAMMGAFREHYDDLGERIQAAQYEAQQYEAQARLETAMAEQLERMKRLLAEVFPE